MDMPWAETAGFAAAALSAVATMGAWMAARRSNATADAVARIEQGRWRADLTPQFEVTIRRPSPGTIRAYLRFELTGPVHLDALDGVSVTVRDDGYDYRSHGAGGPSDDEVAAQVWGPLKFDPNVDGASRDGRNLPSRPMKVGDWGQAIMTDTTPPSWYIGGDWRLVYGNQAVRLWIVCHRGELSWRIPLDVPIRPFQGGQSPS